MVDRDAIRRTVEQRRGAAVNLVAYDRGDYMPPERLPPEVREQLPFRTAIRDGLEVVPCLRCPACGRGGPGIEVTEAGYDFGCMGCGEQWSATPGNWRAVMSHRRITPA